MRGQTDHISKAVPVGSEGVHARAKDKARAVGFNHVALEVGDIDEALAFYGHLFEVKLRGETQTSAFIGGGEIAIPRDRWRFSALELRCLTAAFFHCCATPRLRQLASSQATAPPVVNLGGATLLCCEPNDSTHQIAALRDFSAIDDR